MICLGYSPVFQRDKKKNKPHFCVVQNIIHFFKEMNAQQNYEKELVDKYF